MTGIITTLPPLIEQPPGNSSSNPAGLPGVNYVVALPNVPQTWSALQTFLTGMIEFSGSTSGNTFLNASAIASGTIILPAIVGTDTLLTNNNVAVVTNKSIDGLTNTLTNIPAASFGSTTGTGAVVLSNSPVITTPTGIVKGDVGLGNVANVDTTNASNISSGTLPGARMPALTGDVTTVVGNVATTLATVNANVGTFGSATQSIQITANAKGLLTAAANVTITPAVGSVTGLGTGVATFLATPSSANLRAALTDEVGTGAAYFVGGALGTPASGTATNLTGLPLSGLTTQAAFTFVGNNTSGAAVPTAVDIAALTVKASPAATDLVMISDQAASGAWKKVTVSTLGGGGGGVSSIAGNTGAFTLSGLLTNSTNILQVVAVAKSDQTTGTSNVLAVTPLHQQDHDSAAKAWAFITYSGATPTLAAGYNIASIAAVSTGIININFTTAFASVNYAGFVNSLFSSSSVSDSDQVLVQSVSQLQIIHKENAAATNPISLNVVCFGRQ